MKMKKNNYNEIISKNKFAVILHIFYKDQWEYLRDRIAVLPPECRDLYVTLTDEDADTVKKIKEFDPDAVIDTVPNLGYDVGPFIYRINSLDLDKYDYIIKLHTKAKGKSAKFFSGKIAFNRNFWGPYLIDSLLKSPKTVADNLAVFSDEKVGMIGCDLFYITQDMMLDDVNGVLTRLGLIEVTGSYSFVAGTMFMVRAKLFKLLQNIYTIEDFTPSKHTTDDGTLAHVFERALGVMITQSGYEIRGVKDRFLIPKVYFDRIKIKTRYKGIFLLLRCIFGRTRGKLQNYIFDILAHNCRAFDKKWYLQQYPEVKNSPLRPINHYCAEGWKEGKDPSPRFSTAEYISKVPGLAFSDYDPLTHYVLFGKEEGLIDLSPRRKK